MNKITPLLLGLCFMFLLINVHGQSYKSNIDNLNPVSPTAYQFLKYNQMPVSEYTGIPDISIPLYEIAEDDIKVPLTLSYHAVGIRVNQDASWVGLGWDLQIGSIVQTINDVDDYGINVNGTEYGKGLPDFHGSPVPSEFPMRYQYPLLTDGLGWSNPYPIYAPTAIHSYKIATDYYVPINGNFTARSELLFTDNKTDSESDIFKANFLGHSLSFILDFKTRQIVVLNKKGYAVKKYNDGWVIITPAGEEFYFEEKSVVETNTGSDSFDGWTSTGYDPSAKIWMLTRIITKNKKQIIFNYSRTAVFDSYPKYSEKYQKATLVSTETSQFGTGSIRTKGYLGLGLINTHDPVMKTQSRSREAYVYLSSVVFPKGQVNFITSDRNDMIGAKKLDSIAVTTGSMMVKSYKLNYDYFVSAETTGNGFDPFNPSLDGNTASYRLKLSSIKENNELTHSFKYNATPLPKKNSFAQDLWGFYNGQLSNTSLIPNPVRFNKPSLGDNGNNNSANLIYARACILEEIKFPTGGKVVFDYELNQFDNYWVPDFSTTTNQVSSGYGLRVKSIVHMESDNSISKKTTYAYSDGKAILPINLFRTYTIRRIVLNSTNLVTYSYTIDEVNGNGYFSPSLFGSINGVGYSKVLEEEVDLNGNKKGRIETFFYNNPDVATNSIGSFSQLSATLPAIKQMDVPTNGSVSSVVYYNKDNQPLRKEEKKYTTVYSDIYYGARIFGYTNYIYENCAFGGATCQAYFVAQNLIGYYPIFDFETLVDSTIVKEYSNGDSLVIITADDYDQYNQLKQSIRNNSDNSSERIEYKYPYNYTGILILDSLTVRNRIAEVVNLMKYRKVGLNDKLIYSYNKQFTLLNDKIVESKAIVNMNPAAADNIPYEYLYEQYDPQYANLLQYKVENMTNSAMWGYNAQYVIASVVNAPYNNMAYTSFEDEMQGSNWDFYYLGVKDDDTSPTGNKCYALGTNGGLLNNLSRSGLASSQTYIVSYWSKNGSYGINGTTSITTGRSIRGWTYYEHKITGVTNITFTGNGNIDEVRLYPTDGKMTTYTYKPLIGITSECNENNQIIYYEYDSFGRLKLVKNQDGKILKQYDYQYQKPITQ